MKYLSTNVLSVTNNKINIYLKLNVIGITSFREKWGA